MVSAIQIAEGDLCFANINPADRAVIEQEPGFESLRSMQPGQIQNDAHQMDEESTMADEDNALFGLACFIPVTG